MKVIAIVGQPSSGKDTVAEYVASRGFVHISSGDAIREDMKALSLPTDRTSVSTFAAKRREEEGNEYPVRRIAELITHNTVVSGLRNTSEINVFKQKFDKNFLLIAVEAPLQIRYKWATSRGRVGDDITFERFKEEEKREKLNNSGTHEVDLVIEMANYKLINDGTKEELFKKVEDILEKVI